MTSLSIRHRLKPELLEFSTFRKFDQSLASLTASRASFPSNTTSFPSNTTVFTAQLLGLIGLDSGKTALGVYFLGGVRRGRPTVLETFLRGGLHAARGVGWQREEQGGSQDRIARWPGLRASAERIIWSYGLRRGACRWLLEKIWRSHPDSTRVSALRDRLGTLALSQPERQGVLRIGNQRGLTGIMLSQ